MTRYISVPRRLLALCWLLVALLLVWPLLPLPVAQAATLEVLALDDESARSLRQTIANAEAGDVITFGVSGVIDLVRGELVIDKNLTIVGPETGTITINGGELSRVLAVETGVAVTISGISIQSGSESEGGGIYNQGTLNLTNVTVTRNRASFTGGGIYNEGVLTITGSTIHANTAELGSGAGIENIEDGMLTIVNSTISGNDGGGILNKGTLTILYGTITNNTTENNDGGGILPDSGTATLRNTILAGNSAVVGNDCRGNLTSQGYNLIGDLTDCAVDGDTTTDLTGDPLLQPLATNDGTTLTHRPQASSPAVDVIPEADCADVTTDQRGIERPQGQRCDVGAVEVQGDENVQRRTYLPLVVK